MPPTTKKKKPAKPPRIVPPTKDEIDAAEKDVTAWVEDNMRDWAIYSLKALQEAPWPEKKEIPEWVGILAEGLEWAVVALAPEIGAAIEAGKAAFDVAGKARTFAQSTGVIKPMEEPNIKQIFSDGIDKFRGVVEKRIKDKLVRDWATDVALLRKDKPAKTASEQKAYIWLQMFPVIDYDTDRYYNLKQGIIRALSTAIPVFQQQLADYNLAPATCNGMARRKFQGSIANMRVVTENQAEVDACYAAIPDKFTPNLSFKMTDAEGKVKRAPMVLTWMSMCTKY